MNKQAFFAMLSVCVSVAVSAAAQSSAPSTSPTFNGSQIVQPQNVDMEQEAQATALEKAAAQAIDRGEYALAEKDARQAIALNRFSLTHELLAQALYGQGKYTEALPLYKEISGGGGKGITRNDLPYAMILLKSGQWEQAVQVYNSAMDFTITGEKKNTRTTLSGLGLYEFVCERYPHFDDRDYRPQLLEMALHLAMGAQYDGGASWANNSTNKQALAEYQKALALNPQSDIVNYYVGHGWQQVGENVKAQAAYQKAVALGRGSVKVAAEAALAEAAKLEAWAKLDRERAAKQQAVGSDKQTL